ncbi:DUF6542 domain-containing protein [Nocardia harenae]|uniref:DUF6542 domain-containing protein n=1 Tax=Nocardia harenae TaxID=358707 RepID=UPI0009FF4EED|nr:DUF6542 domain-containing protein [Nocardia harenae]
MPASQRSVLPAVRGVPAPVAVLIAVACTIVGFGVDAAGGGSELTLVFSGAYVLGCLLAVLAVRYRGLFTAMVLPPLLLFASVPLAYQFLVEGGSTSIRDILLNLAIPLVNRFPAMLLATVLVLAVGGARIWQRRREDASLEASEGRRGTSWGRGSSLRETAERARRSRGEPEDDVSDMKTELLPGPSRRPAAPPAEAAPPRKARGSGRSATREREGEPPRRREGAAPARPTVRYRDRDDDRRKPKPKR